jgi:hypothetical protein
VFVSREEFIKLVSVKLRSLSLVAISQGQKSNWAVRTILAAVLTMGLQGFLYIASTDAAATTQGQLQNSR